MGKVKYLDGGDAYMEFGDDPATLSDPNDYLIRTNSKTENAPQPHITSLATRYRYRQEGAQHERERLLELFKTTMSCKHTSECTGEVNIYDHLLVSFGINLAKLMEEK